MIQSCNKKIACVPPENVGVETEVKSGFAAAKHRSSLMALKVVFGNDEYPAGSTVYLPAGAKQPWVTQVHELNGEKFVLVPEDQIILVQTGDLPSETVTLMG
jgi:hypothetical protein